jgi:hypothetical protein
VKTIHEKLAALDEKSEFSAEDATYAYASMPMKERQEMRLRSPITMGELAWLHHAVSQVPAMYRQDLSCMVHDRVNDVVRLIVERVLRRMTKEQAVAKSGSLTFEQARVACSNIGVNLDCGGCAALFYTSFGGYEHDASCTNENVVSLDTRATKALTAWGKARLAWLMEVEPFEKGNLGHAMWQAEHDVAVLADILAAEKGVP